MVGPRRHSLSQGDVPVPICGHRFARSNERGIYCGVDSTLWRRYKSFSTETTAGCRPPCTSYEDNRSALIRNALRAHICSVESRMLEEKDHEGYLKHPQPSRQSQGWEAEAAWPEE